MRVKFFRFSVYDADEMTDIINDFIEGLNVIDISVVPLNSENIMILVTYKSERSLASMVINSAEDE